VLRGAVGCFEVVAVAELTTADLESVAMDERGRFGTEQHAIHPHHRIGAATEYHGHGVRLRAHHGQQTLHAGIAQPQATIGSHSDEGVTDSECDLLSVQLEIGH
jgi:hypothetical protein